MKLLLILLFLIATSQADAQYFVGAKPTVAPTLIVIAGESNATETGHNDSIPAQIGLHSQIKFFDTTAFTFNTLNLLIHGRHSFEGGISKSTDSGTVGNRDFYVVNAAKSGSTIRCWYDSTFLFNGAYCWPRFKDRVDSAITLITAATGYRPAIYLIWSQGVNDADALMNANTWKDSTRSFFTNKVRRRYGDVPIFMTYLPPAFSNYNPYIDIMVGQVNRLYPLETSDLPVADPKHWGTYGIGAIASRFVYGLRGLFKFY